MGIIIRILEDLNFTKVIYEGNQDTYSDIIFFDKEGNPFSLTEFNLNTTTRNKLEFIFDYFLYSYIKNCTIEL